MGDKLFIVKNYVDIPPDNKINFGGEDYNIVFIGKMNYEPNIVAVEYFINNIWRNLLNIFSNINFYIVGSSPTKKILSYSEVDNIYVTGFVDSIEPFFKKASIIIAPMLSGSGIQNKILQAMSYSCCVMTTSIGQEGLEGDNGLIICNSNDEWINNLIFLLNNKYVRIEHGKKSRKFIKDNFSKEIVFKQFKKFIGR